MLRMNEYLCSALREDITINVKPVAFRTRPLYREMDEQVELRQIKTVIANILNQYSAG